MKTYRTIIREGFAKGIRPTNVVRRNSGLFTSCKNARVTKEGLEGYLPDTYSIVDGTYTFLDSVTGSAVTIAKRWPFPQLFLTDVGIFIGAAEGLYFIQQTTPTIVVFSYATGAVTWPWTCAAIMQKPAFTSGDVLVYFDDLSAAYVVVKA